jgi:cystathionine beta-lyase/cystathionine gamma-synthase
MTRRHQSTDTTAVHAGEPEPRIGGAVVMPIFQSANFLHEGTDDYHATRYVRLSNSPNHEALAVKLAALENAEAALVTASGMAAISAALMSVLGAGDHALVLDTPYGGTRTLVTDELPRFGIEATFIDGNAPDAWEAALRPTTRVIYVESISNPMMRVPDLRRVVELARARDLVSMIDNTFATPVNFRPPEIGFDVSVHSATKYLNGHSDIAAGAIIGRADLVARASRLLAHLGGSLDPHACFLLQRGIKTLALRVRRQNANGLALAERLAAHPGVAAVHYPGLATTAGHAHARTLFEGFGGVLALELEGGVEAAERFIDHLTIPVHAASLGGTETLVIRPAVTAYAGVDADERRRLGVSDGLVRISVGIEDTDELVDDVARAVDHAAMSVA